MKAVDCTVRPAQLAEPKKPATPPVVLDVTVGKDEFQGKIAKAREDALDAGRSAEDALLDAEPIEGTDEHVELAMVVDKPKKRGFRG